MAPTKRLRNLPAVPCTVVPSVARYVPRSRQERLTVVFLAQQLKKPVLIEGPAGVGKTELAKVVAQSLGRELIRLQCYEGLDEAKALYEWEYSKQLLYTQLLKDQAPVCPGSL